MRSDELDQLLRRFLNISGYAAFALSSGSFAFIVYQVFKAHWSFLYDPSRPERLPSPSLGNGDILVLAFMGAFLMLILSFLILSVNHRLRWANIPVVALSVVFIAVPPLLVSEAPADKDDRFSQILPQNNVDERRRGYQPTVAPVDTVKKDTTQK